MIQLVYWSSKTNSTKRFIQKLEHSSIEIIDGLSVDDPFILVVPTYSGGGANMQNFVPPAVKKFLSNESNRKNIIGVIGSGNTNFAENYCKAAKLVSDKCGVPLLYRFELMGTETDVLNVKKIIKRLENDSRE